MSQVNLHQHSEHSFLDGYARVDDIARRAKELGQDYVALTDHGEVSGHLAFAKATAAHGVGGVYGIEAYWCANIEEAKSYKTLSAAPISHICLLAADNQGLSNLWALSSIAYDARHHWHRPLADVELLREYSQGIWASDGCMLTDFATKVKNGDEDGARQIYGTLLDIYRDKFYVELHTWQYVDASAPEALALNTQMGELNRAKIRLATEMGIPLVVVNDSHHCWPEDWENKELVWAFNTANTADKLQANLEKMAQKADHLMDEAEIDYWMDRHGVSSSVIQECFCNAHAIAASCRVTLVPTLSIPRMGKTEADDLKALMRACEQGFQRYVVDQGLDEDRYYARLEEELSLIVDKGFCGYFTMVAECVQAYRSGSWAPYVKAGARKEPLLIGPGRGSVGGSLVAYLLGIDIIDPLKYGTLFSRFLTPARKSLPDIDVDVPQSQRPDVLRYLTKRFGRDNVCAIGTLSRNGPKQTLRDLGRVAQIDRAHLDQISSHLEEVERIKAEIAETNPDEADLTWDELIDLKGRELKPWQDLYPNLFKKMEQLTGLARHSSVHASGVLISAEPLLGRIPLRTRKHNTKDQVVTTQLDMHECIAGDTLVGGVPVRTLVDNPPVTLYSLDETSGQMTVNSVVRVVGKGVKELVRIKLMDGTTLRCTPDHLIYTRRGWVPAIDLLFSDEVAVDDG